jgi:hypothetical protein
MSFAAMRAGGAGSYLVGGGDSFAATFQKIGIGLYATQNALADILAPFG